MDQSCFDQKQQVRRSVDFHEKAYLRALSVAIRIIHVWHFTVATGSLPREAGKQKWKATSPSQPVENAYLHSIFQQWALGLSEAMHLSRPVLWGTFTSAGDIGCLLDLLPTSFLLWPFLRKRNSQSGQSRFQSQKFIHRVVEVLLFQSQPTETRRWVEEEEVEEEASKRGGGGCYRERGVSI